MIREKKLYIILVAVCAVALVGLIVLAVSLDASRRDSGNHSTEGIGNTTQSTGGQEDTGSSDSTDSSSTTGNTESQGGDGPKDKWSVTYEEYNAMSGKEQEDFYYSFDSASDYSEWYKAAKKAYEDNKNDIVIGGDGSINLGEILNGKK